MIETELIRFRMVRSPRDYGVKGVFPVRVVQCKMNGMKGKHEYEFDLWVKYVTGFYFSHPAEETRNTTDQHVLTRHL